jgi:DNA invertase Pin-like site-specific DNA recombinase
MTRFELFALSLQHETHKPTKQMAKVGYIYQTPHDDSLDEAREWMQQYGCVQIVEELAEHERLRPQWKQLLANLDRGDEIVVTKLSNAVRGSRELAAFIELCRVKVVRIISLGDRIDTGGKLFPETSVADVMLMFGSLPEEAMALRKASAHVQTLQRNFAVHPKTKAAETKQERESIIVSMYNSGHTIDDIWTVSGFHSRSSVFRILNKYGVKLNRGHFSGPLGKRKK